ncbi:hypothetical protein ElyMa_001079000 [Elysia marginata]|uniref:Endonuclease/exonuclease/phosphatase domain-containing protein n=1 Tax=Elysia marginata TaxID=1093978 RepID=A0AAV4HRD4_9GAST|nr:hypothetical protein ElyMa_001079000 [Elysia marginata]
MVDKYVNTRCGALLMESSQESCVPGPMPRRGPHNANGGTPFFSCGVRRRDKVQITTDHSNNGSNELPLKILQWNVEGVAKKKDALRNRLYEHKRDIACIQETHLTDKIRFSIRGYQCKRMDRAEGTKGGVIILVQNDIQAVEFTKDTNGNAEINGIHIALKNRELLVYNFYCPANKQLSLDAIDIDAGCLILANKALTKAILSAAHECIPCGSRRNYIPYWSEELQALHEEVTEARDNVEKEPSVDNNIRLKAKTARFRRESNTAVRNSWHKKTAQLNLEKDGQKLWRLVRSLNGESNRLSPIALEEENRLLTKRQAANHLVKQFSQVSNITVCNQR